MQKSEVAVTHLPTDKIYGNDTLLWIVGTPDLAVRPLVPFALSVCSFLDELSKALRSNQRASQYSDLMTFAFWCRKSHILKLKSEYDSDRARIGMGLAFHVAPANVPLTFAYSFAFGLLAGNANIVRLPTRSFEQVDLFCEIISNLFSVSTFSDLEQMNAFVRYPANDATTMWFSSLARARLIWGGDETIRSIRSFPLKEGGVDLSFRDRVSICVIDIGAIASLGLEDLNRLAQRFYNDSYFMDQNACSSPSLVIWTGEKDFSTKERFWNALHLVAKKNYFMEPIQAVDKFTDLCRDAIQINGARIRRHGNVLYRLEMPSLMPRIEDCRRRFGYFMEYGATDLNEIVPILQSKCQTITYFGLKKEDLLSLIIDNRLTGVDRVVPIGSAFDMSLVWDGFDLIRQLSRVIDVR